MVLRPDQINVGDVLKISYTFTLQHEGKEITRSDILSARVQVVKVSRIDNLDYCEINLEGVQGNLSRRQNSWHWYDFTHFQHKVTEVRKL